MKKYNLITPEGTRDLLFEECTARREIETKLMELFKNNGYSEVITPFLEFYDVFDFKQETMYKLTDSKGRLMVIRPDSTIPIIRLAQTRLKDLPRPLKLCYNQTIYRANPKESGRDDEIAQTGIEFIGNGDDCEILTLAIQVLELLNVNYRFEIGDCRIFNALIEKENINKEQAEELRQLIENKNYPELTAKAPASIAQLPKLFGGVEIFDSVGANCVRPLELEPLKEICDRLNKRTQFAPTIDLGLTDTHGYYTGILFNGYAEGFGKPILSGGRYRINNTEGIGFAVNVTAIAELQK
ncbi:MAG: ATP phosphoribosyltransferase regulatory subunit [Oscillospiraceae bacterium]|nr:ATP phosphoribosyltransferase regulatory subunit [Oscillospiraceae bacterium]